jgi:glycosyltransferase involved in cell wall biosynthesis
MTQPSIDVSIVVPCYNHAAYLAEAIRSIDAGSRGIEIIVVDDGSTDESSAVAASFGDVTYVRQSNQGVAAARNAGLARSAGRYVIFLDADDRLLPGAVDCGARALDAHPACAMAFGRCVMMGPDGRHWPTTSLPRIDANHHAALLRRNVIWMPAMAIFRRDALVALGGFAAGFDAAADYELYLRITERWEAHDHTQLVAAYRRHEANMSGNAARMLRETLTVMRCHVPGDAVLTEAWQDGCRNWRDFYGTQLVEEIRGHVRRREAVAAARKAVTLACWHPACFVRQLMKKTRLVARSRFTPAARFLPPKSPRPDDVR